MSAPRRYATFEAFRRDELGEPADFSFGDLVADEQAFRGRPDELLFDDQADDLDDAPESER